MINRERIGSLFFLIPGIYGIIFSRNLPLGQWNAPGPGMFPFILSVLMTISGVLWLIFGKRKAGEEEIKWAEIPKQQATPFKIIVLTIAFVFALEPLGFLLTAWLYLFLLIFWVSRYKLWVSLTLSVGIALASWYLFGVLLQVYLPVGWIFD